MKCLFSISILLFLIINIFAQGTMCYFDNSIIVNQKKICKRQCYNFNVNDVEYIVSYSANEDFAYIDGIKKGELFLYRWNSNTNSWVIASDTLQIDYDIYNGNKSMLFKITSNNYDDVRNVRKLRIKVLNNGCIILLLENYYAEPEFKGIYSAYNSIIVLVSDGDKFKSTRFEQYDKKYRNLPYNSFVIENINGDSNYFNYELNFTNNKIIFDFNINKDKSVSFKNKYTNSIYLKNK